MAEYVFSKLRELDEPEEVYYTLNWDYGCARSRGEDIEDLIVTLSLGKGMTIDL